jgi:hypothetical protein
LSTEDRERWDAAASNYPHLRLGAAPRRMADIGHDLFWH